MMKVFALSCLLALACAKPAAEAEADPQFHAPLLAGAIHAPLLAGAVHAPLLAAPYHAAAPNCVTEDVILVTQVCTPRAEEVCSTEIVETEEIEYEKICQDIVDTLCDAPIAAPLAAYHHVKREAEAEAEADPQYYAGLPYAHHLAPVPFVAPAAHAVAHSVTATIKHACRQVTTEHCVDNPKIIAVPVEVEHCHTVTKVTCEPVENILPKTTCEAVITEHTQHAAYAAPVFGHHAAYSQYGK